MSSVRDFLDEAKNAGGDYDNHDAFSFDKPGDTIKGEIVEDPRVVSTRYGDKLVLTINDGAKTWTVWCNLKMAKALSQACEAAGASELQRRGKAAIRFDSEGPRSGANNPPRIWRAKYEAPVGSVPEAEEDPF